MNVFCRILAAPVAATRAVVTVAAVAVIGVSVLALYLLVFEPSQAERYTSGLAPSQFYRSLETDLLDDYADVFGVAHNSGDSLSATREALKHGADVIEIDVVRSGGKLRAGHDSPLPFIGNRFFRGPTLEEVWSASENAEVIKLDLKESSSGYLESVLAFINERPERTTMVSTRDAAALRRFEQEAPHVIRLLSVPSASRFSELQKDTALQEVIDGVSMRHSLYDDERAGWLEGAGFLALAWTVNDSETMNRLVRLGVDAITTDNLAIMELLGGGTSGERDLSTRFGR